MIRQRKTHLLPNFKGQGLGALDKERLPGVGGIEPAGGCGQSRVGGALPRAWNAGHIGPERLHLHQLARRRGGGNVDGAIDAGGAAVGSHRGTSIAAGIFQNFRHTGLDHGVDQHGDAAVLIGARRLQMLTLEQHRLPLPFPRNQGRPTLAEAQVLGRSDCRGVAPKRPFVLVDIRWRKPWTIRQFHHALIIRRTPERRGEWPNGSRAGIDIGGGGHG